MAIPAVIEEAIPDVVEVAVHCVVQELSPDVVEPASPPAKKLDRCKKQKGRKKTEVKVVSGVPMKEMKVSLDDLKSLLALDRKQSTTLLELECDFYAKREQRNELLRLEREAQDRAEKDRTRRAAEAQLQRRHEARHLEITQLVEAADAQHARFKADLRKRTDLQYAKCRTMATEIDLLSHRTIMAVESISHGSQSVAFSSYDPSTARFLKDMMHAYMTSEVQGAEKKELFQLALFLKICDDHGGTSPAALVCMMDRPSNRYTVRHLRHFLFSYLKGDTAFPQDIMCRAVTYLSSVSVEHTLELMEYAIFLRHSKFKLFVDAMAPQFKQLFWAQIKFDQWILERWLLTNEIPVAEAYLPELLRQINYSTDLTEQSIAMIELFTTQPELNFRLAKHVALHLCADRMKKDVRVAMVSLLYRLIFRLSQQDRDTFKPFVPKLNDSLRHLDVPAAIAALKACISVIERECDDLFQGFLLASGAHASKGFVPACHFCRGVSNQLLFCRNCRFTCYCSAKCQTLHWENGHDKVCVPVAPYCLDDEVTEV